MIGLKDQRHALSFHLGVTLDLADQEQRRLDLGEQRPAQINVSHFPALETQGELDLIAFLEEVPRAVNLDFQIVIADANRVDVDLLQPTGAGTGAGFIFFFLLLVAPFAVIHDPADGRAGGWSDFNEVESRFAGHSQSFGSGNDANLLLFVVDQADR